MIGSLIGNSDDRVRAVCRNASRSRTYSSVWTSSRSSREAASGARNRSAGMSPSSSSAWWTRRYFSVGNTCAPMSQ